MQLAPFYCSPHRALYAHNDAQHARLLVMCLMRKVDCSCAGRKRCDVVKLVKETGGKVE